MLLSGGFGQLINLSVDGFQFVVHLETCIDSLECAEAAVKVGAVVALVLSRHILDEGDGILEIRDGLAEEFLALVEVFVIEAGLIVWGNVVGSIQLVDSAVVEHLT